MTVIFDWSNCLENANTSSCGSRMLSIRTINASDWSQYRNLRLESLQDSPHAFASTFENESKRSCEDWQNKIQAALDSGRNHIFLAEYEGVNCGLVWCRLSEVDLNLAEIFQMWVNPDFRNLNIGQGLMKAAINCANHNGANRIQLEVAVTNQPIILFYQKQGFQIVDTSVALEEDSNTVRMNLYL